VCLTSHEEETLKGRLGYPRLGSAVLATGGLTAGLIAGLAGAQSARAQVLAPNLLYTSVQPCRVIDTRLSAGGALIHGVAQAFNIVGSQNGLYFAAQGGKNGGCGLPDFDTDGLPQVQAVMFNFVAVGASGAGDIIAWPSDQSPPNASILNYANSAALGFLNIANGIAVPVRQNSQGADVTFLAQVSDTHLVADVVGYFSAGSAVSNGAPFNIYLGLYAGNRSGATGMSNTVMGFAALEFNTSGSSNTVMGTDAMQSNTMGYNNTAIGFGALRNNTTGPYSTAIGSNALSNSTGQYNLAVGANALVNATTGATNTALGTLALPDLQDGSGNVAVGENAGAAIVSGIDNVYLEAAAPSDESYTIRIGYPVIHTATYIAGIYGAASASGSTVYVNSNGKLGTATSSLRFKEDVEDMGQASDGLMRLRPVSFHYKPEYDDGSHLLQYGLIAEEVARVYPDLVQMDESGRPFSVRYHFINAMLLNEVQKQQTEIRRQRASSEEQAAELESQRAQLVAELGRGERQQARIAELEQAQAEQRRQIDQLVRQVQALRELSAH
jgi:hypothetical protein